MIPKECKRLAEVDFPIAVVSKHSAREKSIRHGHPSTLHLWWARRPLAACRVVLYASDPAFLDAVLADERGWRPLPLEPMTMLVFRHESLMEFSRESFTFIAQGKRGKAP